jgi:uncharacterized protein (TIGR00290 family)
MKRKTLVAWSSGKDSAWTLHTLQQDPGYDPVGLFCVVNEATERVAMHAVRRELLQWQARAIGLPLDILTIPDPCSNEVYEAVMADYMAGARDKGVECIAFGDLYLEGVRQYREDKFKGTGIEPVFPVWGVPTADLSRDIIGSGIKAVITCVDPAQLPAGFVGDMYGEAFLRNIPDTVDPCGERGEFHSFVFDGPMFSESVPVIPGGVVHRNGFVYMDLTAGRG